LKVDNRLSEPIEVAAYYVVSEALANAAKHAQASLVRSERRRTTGFLDVTIRDNGIGGSDLDGGSGLIGLGDRVAARGGTIANRQPRRPGDLSPRRTASKEQLTLVGKRGDLTEVGDLLDEDVKWRWGIPSG
jgi:hypothetical protein